MYPDMFKTAFTASGQQAGYGFERVAASVWYAFYDNDRNRWLQAAASHTPGTHVSSKPGPWEKFKLSSKGNDLNSRVF